MTFGIYLIASITGAYVTKNKWKNHLYDLIFSFVHGMFYFLCLTIWKMLYVRTLQVGLANFVMPGIYILTAFAVSCLKK